jgi:hypothetical protein
MADHVGWDNIAKATGKALGCSVSESTARRYARPTWPTKEDPDPLPVAQMANGVRWIAGEDLAAWARRFKGRAGHTIRPTPKGDKRRRTAA